MIRGRCTAHPGAKLQCPACNGSKTSKAKTQAAQQNAKKGGRPLGTEEKESTRVWIGRTKTTIALLLTGLLFAPSLVLAQTDPTWADAERRNREHRQEIERMNREYLQYLEREKIRQEERDRPRPQEPRPDRGYSCIQIGRFTECLPD